MSQSTLVEIGNFSLVTVGIKNKLDRMKFVQQQFQRVASKVPSVTFNKSAFVAHLLRGDSHWRLVDSGEKPCYDSVVVLKSNMTTWGYNLSVYSSRDGLGAPDWQGNLSDFSKFLTTLATPTNSTDSNLIGKIVRFSYSGGHDYNGTRLVKVNRLDDLHIKGTDLLSDSQKTYRLDRINGEVKVLD